MDSLEDPGNLNRKDFLLRCGALGLCALGLPDLLSAASSKTGLRKALYWRPMPGGKTQCTLCPNLCVRGEGEVGRCHVRANVGGVLRSLVYGRPCVIALDETEKCPLNHFRLPGKAFSVATAGCNLDCQYCHNWSFAQAGPDEAPKVYSISPEEVVGKALENKASAIAYFYTDPVVFYEYMLDIARLAKAKGLKNIMVTAGYISPDALRQALPLLDAVALGLKGFDDGFYRKYVGCGLEPVKKTVEILAADRRVWWEVVHLILPSLNDDIPRIAAMARWLKTVAGPEVPLHFTRFRPDYRLKRLPVTPAKTLTKAREAAMAQGLKYVYVGNMPGHAGANTFCPSCGKAVVERTGFAVVGSRMKGSRCGYCGAVIKGVWS